MKRYEMVMKNSLGLEIKRFEIQSDPNDEFPLEFSILMGDDDLDDALGTMLPGDTLTLVEVEELRGPPFNEIYDMDDHGKPVT